MMNSVSGPGSKPAKFQDFDEDNDRSYNDKASDANDEDDTDYEDYRRYGYNYNYHSNLYEEHDPRDEEAAESFTNAIDDNQIEIQMTPPTANEQTKKHSKENGKKKTKTKVSKGKKQHDLQDGDEIDYKPNNRSKVSSHSNGSQKGNSAGFFAFPQVIQRSVFGVLNGALDTIEDSAGDTVTSLASLITSSPTNDTRRSPHQQRFSTFSEVSDTEKAAAAAAAAAADAAKSTKERRQLIEWLGKEVADSLTFMGESPRVFKHIRILFVQLLNVLKVVTVNLMKETIGKLNVRLKEFIVVLGHPTNSVMRILKQLSDAEKFESKAKDFAHIFRNIEDHLSRANMYFTRFTKPNSFKHFLVGTEIRDFFYNIDLRLSTDITNLIESTKNVSSLFPTVAAASLVLMPFSSGWTAPALELSPPPMYLPHCDLVNYREYPELNTTEYTDEIPIDTGRHNLAIVKVV